MLNAFKQQLKEVAKNRNEEFLGHIRTRVSSEKVDATAEALRNLIVVMPDMIAQVQARSNDTRIPSKEKKLLGFMLTYLYHPVDFLPESGKGLFNTSAAAQLCVYLRFELLGEHMLGHSAYLFINDLAIFENQ